MAVTLSTARQSTVVAIGARAVMIEGAPGSGKSSLALSLIDRGAVLVGDDSVLLDEDSGRLIIRPHPRTRGLVEVRGLGLLEFPVRDEATAALLVLLTPGAPRYIETADRSEIAGVTLPVVRLEPHGNVLPIVVELALSRFGLP